MPSSRQDHKAPKGTASMPSPKEAMCSPEYTVFNTKYAEILKIVKRMA